MAFKCFNLKNSILNLSGVAILQLQAAVAALLKLSDANPPVRCLPICSSILSRGQRFLISSHLGIAKMHLYTL